MSNYKTTQEKFWAGEFGNNYVDRNIGDKIIASNTYLFSNILSRTNNIQSIIEFGPNIGLNLIAIHNLLPFAEITGVEINKKACDILTTLSYVNVINTSLLDFSTNKKYDITFTKGVLIHQNPDELPKIYEQLYKYSNRYILICEYYNPVPVEIKYRGHDSVLFKRDFAGEMLDMFTEIKLINYGFIYHRDNVFPSDDITWFLMEK